ncbi:DDE-type integrase/transposase/recombinase [Roseovarius sp. C7]|uniref:DDE-type integrase/transposase/recombinase n=1 Tax=Roseovarius sp. C7 TaxID=3398643 RepID=UPI0039F6708B
MAKAILNKPIKRVRLHRPVTIETDKAHSYRRVIREINHHNGPSSTITHPGTTNATVPRQRKTA